MASLFSTISFQIQGEGREATLWLFMILLSSFVPYLTAKTAFNFTNRRSDGWMAGLLALFSGFYLLYYAIPETFSVVMILGFILISCLSRLLSEKERNWTWVLTWGLAGIITGLLHMTRAEGLIWLLIAISCLIYASFKAKRTEILIPALLLLLGGYFLISAAWYGRNFGMWGHVFPPGTSRTLWMTNYNQTFLFPVSGLTFNSWIQAGINSILNARLDALWMNLKSAVAVQGGILLVPFIITGWWLKRHDRRLILAGLYYLVTLIIMTMVFPFAGSRGGFIHSAAGVQIFLWALVPVGLDKFIQWGAQKRGWQIDQARRVFQIGIIAIMILLSGIIFYQRVVVTTNGVSNWLIDETKYKNVYQELIQLGDNDEKTLVMVKNPPGWNLVTRTQAIVIPDGGVSALIAAANKYGANLLLLDKDHPDKLKNFFEGEERIPELELIFIKDGIQVYRFIFNQ